MITKYIIIFIAAYYTYIAEISNHSSAIMLVQFCTMNVKR